MNSTLAFISTMDTAPWGGSEELWSRTAARLARAGTRVHVNVAGCTRGHRRLTEITEAGGEVTYRSFSKRGFQRIWERFVPSQPLDWLKSISPHLTVISMGCNGERMGWAKACRDGGYPYVLIAQMATPHFWPRDPEVLESALGYQNAVACYFVARANLELTCLQMGIPVLTQARIVRNPFGVSYQAKPPWPPSEEGFRMACVGRLEPEAKGQDLLFRVLSQGKWRSRALRVTLYGEGSAAEGLGRLKTLMGLDRVALAGFEPDIEKIWRENHLLVLPSRFEGLPLALVEAMLCGRPSVVTAVGGNAEVVEDGVTGFIAAAPEILQLDEAMERAWENRAGWRDMGEKAAVRIRQMIPADPIALFAQELIRCVP